MRVWNEDATFEHRFDEWRFKLKRDRTRNGPREQSEWTWLDGTDGGVYEAQKGRWVFSSRPVQT